MTHTRSPGEQLRDRRVNLDPARWRNRKRFIADHGLGESEYKMLMDAETDRRTNFEPATFALFDKLYVYEPGSVERLLTGQGRPVPKEERLDELVAAGETERIRDILLDLPPDARRWTLDMLEAQAEVWRERQRRTGA